MECRNFKLIIRSALYWNHSQPECESVRLSVKEEVYKMFKLRMENSCHAYTTQRYCAKPETTEKLKHWFIGKLALSLYSVRVFLPSCKDESTQRQNASNYQDTAMGINVCTRFSSGGGKQLYVVRNLWGWINMMKGLNYVIAGLETISLKIDKSSAGRERTPTPSTEEEWQVLSTGFERWYFAFLSALEWYLNCWISTNARLHI